MMIEDNLLLSFYMTTRVEQQPHGNINHPMTKVRTSTWQTLPHWHFYARKRIVFLVKRFSNMLHANLRRPESRFFSRYQQQHQLQQRQRCGKWERHSL